MIYQGSKRRIVKHILPIILADRRPNQWYVEPFIGGANSFQEVVNPRLGCDVNKWVACYLNAVKDGWLPPTTVTKEKWLYLKKNLPLIPETAFAGVACSFGSVWFCSYSKPSPLKCNGYSQDFALCGYNNAIKQAPKLKGSFIFACEYDQLEIPDNSIIYCDPPYAGTKGYGLKFDHDKFWEWCRQKKLEGHKIFISEANAPDDFECVWGKEITRHINNVSKCVRRSEKLFTI